MHRYKKLKVNDKFILYGKINGEFAVHLFCQVESIKPTGELNCWVINGAWNFTMSDYSEIRYRSPIDVCDQVVKIADGLLKFNIDHGYSASIESANKLLSYPEKLHRVLFWLHNQGFSVVSESRSIRNLLTIYKLRIKKCWKILTESTKKHEQSMKYASDRSRINTYDDLIDRDIPF